MKGKTSIVSAVHHLRIAKEYFDDFIREHQGSTGARLFKNYSEKLSFVYRDLAAQPAFIDAPDISEGIRREWHSDVLGIVELYAMISHVTPEARTALVEVIEHILKGETLKVEYLPNEEVKKLKEEMA